MQHPEKWRETTDPFKLPFRRFTLLEVLGYPHAGNDVFFARGIFKGRERYVFIKAARQIGADIRNEVETIRALGCPLMPEVLEYDAEGFRFSVTAAMPGRRLSVILGENENGASLAYMREYGRTLAKLHSLKGDFAPVKDRRFFHIPSREFLEKLDLAFLHGYLTENAPKETHTCFCHGDFHYANILWEKGHISAILDLELAGMGERDRDIAWALLHRPGQKFLNTEEEIALFLEGYGELQAYDEAAVRYYMAMMYPYFYDFGGDVPGYREYVRQVLKSASGQYA